MKRIQRTGLACALATALSIPQLGFADSLVAERSTLAITYREGVGTEVDLVGTTAVPGRLGSADVKRRAGRTELHIEMNALPHPQTLGAPYTTYVLWAVAPEGRAESLAELPHSRRLDLEVTTQLQTFGLLVAAEPHAAVRLPSPQVVAENVPTDDTRGVMFTGRLEYSGAVGSLYAAPRTALSDLVTPLSVQGARNAVEIARRAGADRHARNEMVQAEMRLAVLERSWPEHRNHPRRYDDIAHDVMRLGEHARHVAIEREEQARVAAERRAASDRLASARVAESQARIAENQARQEADRARQEAEFEGKRAAVARMEADRARLDASAAQAEAQNARLNAEAARLAAEESRARLQEQLSAILDTRQTARGIIVSLSDVLFDTGQATLTLGAREKLAKLSGVLLAYPGSYSVATEGHTDAVGAESYNLDLSRRRAETVLGFLMSSGVPQPRVTTASGFGESQPVASNDSAAGRQMNRRVEIVISDLG